MFTFTFDCLQLPHLCVWTLPFIFHSLSLGCVESHSKDDIMSFYHFKGCSLIYIFSGARILLFPWWITLIFKEMIACLIALFLIIVSILSFYLWTFLSPHLILMVIYHDYYYFFWVGRNALNLKVYFVCVVCVKVNCDKFYTFF